MTLDDIANAACAKVGIINESYELDLARNFANYRYKLIYDTYQWLDSRTTVPSTIVAAGPYLVMPPEIERVISIRYSDKSGSPGLNDRQLEPVNSSFLAEASPGIFEETGQPQYYEEFTDPASTERRIRLFPTPDVDGAMLIIGKQPVDVLTSNSTPRLRNIDNALMAYVIGDLWEYLRQSGHAGEKFKEAQSLLQGAQTLESGQANRPRQSKQLTVAGNSLAEMTDSVCSMIGSWSPESRIDVRESLRRNYQMVYDGYLWCESQVMARVVADGEQLVAPEYIGRIIALRPYTTLMPAFPVDQAIYFQTYPDIFSYTGNAFAFSYLPSVAVNKLMSQNEKLLITSSSPKDDGAELFIKGQTLGIEASENPVLPIETENTYDTPLTIAKPVTAGDVTITGKDSGTIYGKILAGERERRYIRMWLQQHSGTPFDVLILGKLKIQPLVTDQDTPALRDIQNVLINAAATDMLTKMGNAAGATVAKGKADAAMKTLMDLERQQSAQQPRIIPMVEPICNPFDDFYEVASK